MLRFFVAMIPPATTHQTKQVAVVRGKPVVYEPAELKAARRTLEAHMARFAPACPYTRGVRLVVKWCFPMGAKHSNGEYRITKPDTDNLQKLLKDVMTTLRFWTDDALVASETVEKFWSDTPGLFVEIDEL